LIKLGIIGNAMCKEQKPTLYQNKKLIIYVKEEDSVDNGGISAKKGRNRP
jgi:hypothetical protein